MFYAHFVLTKKGPLARIWLAAHWDKKLTKAHVFETNIDHSVEAILEPKVKLALRTSGHLLLGVVRIYSRKAKYLLSDCNEAFVKIKMAFRPGVVDLPEENREASVAAITLQENFQDFDSFADLSDIDVHVNQSRPEEITMREDLGNIQLVGDDGFGDVMFDEREMGRDASSIEGSLYKSPEHEQLFDKPIINDKPADQPMDIDAPVPDDGFGVGLDDGAFIAGGHEDDSSDDDNFGGEVDQEFFGDNFMEPGGLFEEPQAPPPVLTETLPPELAPQDILQENQKDATKPPPVDVPQEQTTLVPDEGEAFVLGPIDTTAVPDVERPTRKRKRKLVVDEIKGIQSETMKMQLSDTTDIITTLDLAPPTKKLMLWKETGGVEKLFALAAHSNRSKPIRKLFNRNLITRHIDHDLELDLHLQADVTLEAPEMARDIPSVAAPDPSVSRIELTTHPDPDVTSKTDVTRESLQLDAAIPDVQASDIFGTSLIEPPPDAVLNNEFLVDEPPSVAPFSVAAPDSVAPMSVAPMSVPPVFEDIEEITDIMPENEEQEEKRLTKRSQQMHYTLSRAFRHQDRINFFDMAGRLNRKQSAAKFYTLLVLKKSQTIDLYQQKAFGDIAITKGVKFDETS